MTLFTLRIFFLIAIVFGNSFSNAAPICAELFNSPENEKPQLERFTFNHQELNRTAEIYSNSNPYYRHSIFSTPIQNLASEYAFSLYYPGKNEKRKKTLFRGMSLKDSGALIKVLKEGFYSSGSSFKKTYFDDAPMGAISYCLSPNNGAIRLKNYLLVLFELDYTKMPYVKIDRVGFSTSKHVPANAIRKIHIFDKESKNYFPITVLTPEEFIQFYESQ